MSIKKLFEEKKPIMSFEIFPPKPESDVSVVYRAIDGLVDLNPDFISVTYGALGTTKGNTVEMASYIKNHHHKESLAHLTCVGTTHLEIDETLNRLEAAQVNNVLALRGDRSEQSGKGQNGGGKQAADPFSYAKDLVTHIKKRDAFSIGAACYPEGHLESPSPEMDILYIKEKTDQGVDFLITQLFLDNEMFYEYFNKLRRNNINVPVVAGILPVLNKKQIARITELSGCSLSPKFKRILEKYESDEMALKQAGTAYAIEQIIDLYSWGIDGIHLYTMNRIDTTREIINSIHYIKNHLRRVK